MIPDLSIQIYGHSKELELELVSKPSLSSFTYSVITFQYSEIM